MYQNHYMPDLINDIISLESLYLFENEYKSLLTNSNGLLDDKKFQAHYLSHYKVVQKMKYKINSVVPVYNRINNHQFLSVFSDNLLINYVWNKGSNKFEETSSKCMHVFIYIWRYIVVDFIFVFFLKSPNPFYFIGI